MSIVEAADNGRLDEVRRLELQGADVNSTDLLGDTPLSLACTNGHKSVAVFLIEKRANVNARNKFGITPLMAAAMYGRANVVNLLLEAGADARLTDKDGRTALSMAARNNKPAVVALLDAHEVRCKPRAGLGGVQAQ